MSGNKCTGASGGDGQVHVGPWDRAGERGGKWVCQPKNCFNTATNKCTKPAAPTTSAPTTATPSPSPSPVQAWYDCSYKGFKSCDDDSVCSSDGGKTVCAKSTVDAGMCTTDKATYCGDTRVAKVACKNNAGCGSTECCYEVIKKYKFLSVQDGCNGYDGGCHCVPAAGASCPKTCAGIKMSSENLKAVEQRLTQRKNAYTDILQVKATATGELATIEVTGEAHDQGYAGRCSRMWLEHQPVAAAFSIKTRRISYWSGKVNQRNVDGKWLTDPDGRSGANIDMLSYCKKWWVDTTSVEKLPDRETISFSAAGNNGDYKSTRDVYACRYPSSTKAWATIKSPVVPRSTSYQSFTWKLDVDANRAPVRAGDVLKLRGFGCWGAGIYTRNTRATFTIKESGCSSPPATATTAPSPSPVVAPCVDTRDSPEDCARAPHGQTNLRTCWGDSAYQMCPLNRQGAYDLVQAAVSKDGDQAKAYAVYHKLQTDGVADGVICTKTADMVKAPDAKGTGAEKANEVKETVTDKFANCEERYGKNVCQVVFACIGEKMRADGGGLNEEEATRQCMQHAAGGSTTTVATTQAQAADTVATSAKTTENAVDKIDTATNHQSAGPCDNVQDKDKAACYEAFSGLGTKCGPECNGVDAADCVKKVKNGEGKTGDACDICGQCMRQHAAGGSTTIVATTQAQAADTVATSAKTPENTVDKTLGAPAKDPHAVVDSKYDTLKAEMECRIEQEQANWDSKQRFADQAEREQDCAKKNTFYSWKCDDAVAAAAVVAPGAVAPCVAPVAPMRNCECKHDHKAEDDVETKLEQTRQQQRDELESKHQEERKAEEEAETKKEAEMEQRHKQERDELDSQQCAERDGQSWQCDEAVIVAAIAPGTAVAPEPHCECKHDQKAQEAEEKDREAAEAQREVKRKAERDEVERRNKENQDERKTLDDARLAAHNQVNKDLYDAGQQEEQNKCTLKPHHHYTLCPFFDPATATATASAATMPACGCMADQAAIHDADQQEAKNKCMLMPHHHYTMCPFFDPAAATATMPACGCMPDQALLLAIHAAAASAAPADGSAGVTTKGDDAADFTKTEADGSDPIKTPAAVASPPADGSAGVFRSHVAAAAAVSCCHRDSSGESASDRRRRRGRGVRGAALGGVAARRMRRRASGRASDLHRRRTTRSARL